MYHTAPDALRRPSERRSVRVTKRPPSIVRKVARARFRSEFPPTPEKCGSAWHDDSPKTIGNSEVLNPRWETKFSVNGRAHGPGNRGGGWVRLNARWFGRRGMIVHLRVCIWIRGRGQGILWLSKKSMVVIEWKKKCFCALKFFSPFRAGFGQKVGMCAPFLFSCSC
jgi:hypothetical protein